MTKVILITGCSSGLGVSIAVQAAQAGHTVYATMRNLSKRGALDTAASEAGVSLNVLALDVQDSATIVSAVGAIIAKEGRIDTLINNAGAGYVRSTEQALEEDISWVMDVNFMGVVRCTKAVMPYMRKARAGHVITIGSVGGLVGQPFNEIYCGAKFGVEGYMEAMASYITPSFGIHFTTVEPGGIVSEFANSALKQIEASGGMLDDEYTPILQAYIGGATSRQSGDVYQTADEVASVVMDVLGAENPPVRCRTSNWGEDLCQLKTGLDPDGKKLQAKIVEQFLGQ
ncbi:SDR family oxidoreductase [Pelagimonas varians]|uniref:Sepiapterin reductase n=1 Tax=Pelagimonas varians TaxID=696760 RepID=A0A238KK92_9RHOB|nr:SDR family oxidoreductase [Pelagimonas varians]PYG29238.1 short-subunit dehydrogenase [Pelagimonas varians]SMX43193.1 Sepiapterin reductase [Pelagimonas varians]